MGKIIGIDLGTTNSEVAIMEGDSPRAITSAEGSVFIPSVVAWTDDGERLVGEPAKRQAVTNPDRTIAEIKRKMGSDHEVTIDGETYTPEQISAMILQKIKADAEDYLGEEVTEAVITVPAYFDDNQRKATKDAGRIAGLEVKRLINEPTAAAFAYGLDKEQDATIAVWDLGGGTFDITIMEVGTGEEGSIYEVLATNGDTHLGGKDIDEAVAERLKQAFQDEHGVDVDDREALQRIREEAEETKIDLSSTKTRRVNLPYLLADDEGPKHLEYEMTRAELEKLARPILERTKEPCRQAMEDADVTPSDIDHVILVGGTSRMPLCRDIVEEIFDQRPERGVDPLEAVASGAAIQAGILSGDVEQDMVLLDVTPLTLGVEVQGGMKEPLIERNTTIPTKATKTFTTAQDNQTAVTVHVLQGERPMAQDNTSLGHFNLQGIPPAPRGVPQIEVTFDIDADGILNVSAEEQQSGEQNEITISGAANLSDEEIERMQEEAEKHAEEDKRRRELAEARNEAENAVYTAERTLDEFDEEIDDDLRSSIEDKKQEVEDLLDDEDLDDPAPLRDKKDQLLQELQGVGAKMYGEQGQPGAGAAGQTGAGPGGPGGPGGASTAGQTGPGAGAGAQPGPGAQTGAEADSSEDDTTEVDYEVKDDDED